MIKKIINLLKNDCIIAIPTDTIYGLIGNPFSKIAVEKIFNIKNREKTKSLSIFLKNKYEIEKYCIINNFKVRQFIFNELKNDTIILNKRNINYLNLIAKDDTLGIRVPNNKLLLKILNRINFPLFATSVNVSGKKECLFYEEIIKNFSDKIDLVVKDENINSSNKSSKIYKVDGTLIGRIR